MQQTFLDIIYKIFYDTAQRDFKDVRLLLSEKFSFPSIEFEPKIEVKIPIPKKTNGGVMYSGYFFKDSSQDQTAAWGLFLTTVYHLAAHVAVSNYSLYNNWVKNKTPRIFWKVIDFIEDNAVERYLSSTNPDVWTNINEIKKNYERYYQNDTNKSKFALRLGSKKINSIKQEMSNEPLLCFDKEHQSHVLYWASELYQNQQGLQDESPFYYEQRNSNQSLIFKKNKIESFPSGKFQNTINKLNFLYNEEKDRIEDILHKMRKDIVGLNFDEISLPSEDIFEYFKLKEKNKKIIKKIREQIRTVYNNSEDPQTNFYGEIDMELAIQAIASNNERYAEVFNKTEEQRIEETWAILIDNSASLRMRFEQVKDFMLCLAEASEELTGPSGSWGLYSYDQKFSILKDHKGKYNQDVRARLGGLHSGGLSYTPDAILLAGRMLAKNPADLKHLFVFTDDFPTGLWNYDQKLFLAIKQVERMGIEVIGIGLSANISKYFSDSCWGVNIRDLVDKFVRIYRMKSSKFL
ncbi:MAG: VWA domain-containing protein [Nitrosopumilus sp.]|nr:VWA domain-containing protein [Nitrosopumilus sp.]